MPQERNSHPPETPGSAIRFSLTGFILFCLCLALTGALLTTGLLWKPASSDPAGAALRPQPSYVEHSAGPDPAWGELVVYDINLEQPAEYLGFELANTNHTPQWTFPGMNRERVGQIMSESGMTADLVSRALSDQFSTADPNAVIVHPDARLLTSLSPPVRSKFYGQLGKLSGNPYMTCPFCFPRKSFEKWFGDGTHDSHGLSLARKLFYPRGDGVCFSDIEFLLQQLPSDTERLDILRLLSRQSAVLVRVRIRPDTDVDKLLDYWSQGIATTDLRPLIESTARLQDGATISLLYFLPKFARDHLYTFPMLSSQTEPVMDCHWSTMNFFNDPPDDRFTGTSNTVPYLQANYDLVTKPEGYGDVILIQNQQGKTLHSAVHIAADIVYTKNGYNAAQPWMLMHLDDLLTRYSQDQPPKMLVYRKRNR